MDNLQEVTDVSATDISACSIGSNITIKLEDLSCNYLDVSNNVSVVCNKYYIQQQLTHVKKRTWLNIYSVEEQQITQGSPIVFEMSETIHGHCCHAENTGNIWICATGYYQVYMNLYHLEPCQFSLCKNTTDIIPNSTVGSLIGSSQNSNLFIVKIRKSDMTQPCTMSATGYACLLQVVNNSSLTPYVTLIGSHSSANTIPQVTAALTIVSL
uniref:Uncharacterized protein n=1 Tax=viral metagenome TaxID=1070528 RepID=A0A6C0I631_9ZZZZ